MQLTKRASRDEQRIGVRRDAGNRLATRESQMNDEFDSVLFEPVVILPSQIAAAAPWVSHTSGPIALMLAVLEDAVRCVERGRRRRHPGIRTQAAEAEAW